MLSFFFLDKEHYEIMEYTRIRYTHERVEEKKKFSYILNQLEGSQCVTVFLLLEYDRQKKHAILYSYQGSQTHCTSNCTVSRNGSKFDFMNGFPQYELHFFIFIFIFIQHNTSSSSPKFY